MDEKKLKEMETKLGKVLEKHSTLEGGVDTIFNTLASDPEVMGVFKELGKFIDDTNEAVVASYKEEK